jgi:transcriptional regulator with XRE-family HTH domain
MVETKDKIIDLDIKKRVVEILKLSGWSKSELARQMNIAPSYLNSVLTDNQRGFSATMLKGFASAGINLNWLLTGDGETLFLNEDYKKRAEIAEAKNLELEKDLNSANILSKELKSWILNIKGE